ncbi:MAG: MFS transporter [Anaerolineae bacterium]
MRRISFGRVLSVTVLSFALAVSWNTLEPSLMGRKVLELVPKGRNTALGLATFGGLVIASLVQPIVGVLSDRTLSRWGRRTPYIIVGTLATIASLFLIAYATAFWQVLLGLGLIQMSSNTAQGPWQALMPDCVPAEQRGVASGVKAVLDIVGFMVGRLAAGYLISQYTDVGARALLWTISLPTLVWLVCLVATLPASYEGRMDRPRADRSIRDALTSAFVVDLKAYPAFGRWFVNRALFWGAFIAVNTFLLFYLMDVVGLTEAEGQRFVGQLSAMLGVALIVATILSGYLADRYGRKPMLIAAGLLASVGTLSVLVVRDLAALSACGMLIGVGIGVFLSANWAWITDIVPQGEAARYLGVANVATAVGSGASRLLGGVVIDRVNSLFSSATAGYLLVYALAALAFLLSTAAVLPLRRPASDGIESGVVVH